MDDDWIAQFLYKTHVGHISTRDGNQPFINPTSFWYSTDSHEIYIHSNAHGRMRFNADNNPEACFECFRSGRLLPSNLALEVSFQYKCVIAFGKIHVIEKMNENGIGLAVHYKPIHLLSYYKRHFKFNKNNFPTANFSSISSSSGN